MRSHGSFLEAQLRSLGEMRVRDACMNTPVACSYMAVDAQNEYRQCGTSLDKPLLSCQLLRLDTNLASDAMSSFSCGANVAACFGLRSNRTQHHPAHRTFKCRWQRAESITHLHASLCPSVRPCCMVLPAVPMQRHDNCNQVSLWKHSSSGRREPLSYQPCSWRSGLSHSSSICKADSLKGLVLRQPQLLCGNAEIAFVIIEQRQIWQATYGAGNFIRFI